MIISRSAQPVLVLVSLLSLPLKSSHASFSAPCDICTDPPIRSHDLPRILYEPLSGAVYFDDVYVVSEVIGNLVNTHQLGLQLVGGDFSIHSAAELPFASPPIKFPTEPIFELPVTSTFVWDLNDSFAPITEPTFVGNIVGPIKELSSILAIYHSAETGLRISPVTFIPEPTTSTLLLTCCVVPAVLRRRR